MTRALGRCLLPSWAFLAAVSLVLTGCGGQGSTPTGTAPTPPIAPVTPAVTVTTAASGTIAAGQSLSVSVQVSSSSGTPTGSVVLFSGNYASFPVTLSASGSLTFSVPSAVLQPGTDTFTATFTPANATTYNTASGSTTTKLVAFTTAPLVTASSVSYPTLGHPFRALPAAGGNVLVSVTGTPSGVQVFKPAAVGGLQASCLNYLRPAFQANNDSVLGIALFGNGTGLAESIGNDGVVFHNASIIQTCTSTGTAISQGTVASNQGSFDVAVTPDGKYAFVANEYGVASGATTQGNIGVVALQYDAYGNVSTTSTLLGQIATGGNAIAGILLSPDGKRLYVTSEVTAASTAAAGSGNTVLTKTGCVQQPGSSSRNGLLTVIDVAKAEANPTSAAILATVNAGCSPVRLVETDDLSTLWVAARGDNRVLAFNPGMLEFQPDNALIGYADTGGTAPVGLRLFHGQRLLAVANSNRFNTGLANLTVLNAELPSSATVTQTLQTGNFPREITAGSDDATLYLTNYDSNTLQVIATTVK